MDKQGRMGSLRSLHSIITVVLIFNSAIVAVNLVSFINHGSWPSARNTVEEPMCLAWTSFADMKYALTLQRITDEAVGMNLFTHILPYNESSLQAHGFFDLYGTFVRENGRGFGYWIWKPWIINLTMHRLPEGCFLVYTDAGCKIVPTGAQRLLEYIQMLRGRHLLAFELGHLEKYWTKGDIFDLFQARHLKDTNQLAASILIVRNSKESREFISRWFTSIINNPLLVSDSPSSSPNFPEFIENRHDQSFWSVMVKSQFQANSVILPDETYHHDFSLMNTSIPFWTYRWKFRR